MVAKSDRIMWPDCSPPRLMPSRACARRHSGRRPGCGAASARALPRKRSSPRLDITVATMPPPRSRPLAAQDRAISARIWSPSISSPFSSAISSRSASPSSAMPRCAPCSTTWAQRYSGTVEPQPRLMLKPSGDDADRDHLGAQLPQHRRRHAVGGAVGAIDHDLQAVQPQAAGKAGLGDLDVAPGGVVQPRGAAERRRRRQAIGSCRWPSAPRSRSRSRREA